MKKSLFSMSMAALLASTSATTWASSLTVPNDFTAGTTAVAADVNGNFTAVETSVNDNDTRITTNTGNIGTNTTNIGNNTTAIGTNTTNIGNNTTAIGTNTTNITTNTGDIAALQGAASCPADMVAVGPLCVDTYEASLWDAPTGGNAIAASTCLADGSDCAATGPSPSPIYAQSRSGEIPTANITWYQAIQACANVGKRLPTTAEWQMAASGTPAGLNADTANGCNTQTAGAVAAGSSAGGTTECISNTNAFDMVGNLWEWSADLNHLDATGTSFVFTTTDTTVARMLGASYSSSGISGTRALATTNGTSGVNNGPLRTDATIGFRCVK